MFSLARAHLALEDEGQIANEELRRRFQMTIVSFMDLVEASKHYPSPGAHGWNTSASTPSQ